MAKDKGRRDETQHVVTDHDRLFKELLTTFFEKFVELFLPNVGRYLEPDSLQFLDKEIFVDVTAGERYEADLVARAKVRGEEAFFLIHVENQAKAQAAFGRRMFRYFSHLFEKHDVPIYPVVIFSYDAPRRAEPQRFRMEIAGRRVLDFKYHVIQLNRLSWRSFINQPNPVASALMAKMRIAPKDRPRVKLECLRMITTLRLDPARATLLNGFVESYLKLNAKEQQRFEAQIATLPEEERMDVLQLPNSWMEKGMQQGLQQGLQQEALSFAERLLRRRFGALPADMEARVGELSREELEELGEALLDFSALSDVEAWLASHSAA